MAEPTAELMLEILKDLQSGQKDVKAQLHGIRDELSAMRTHMAGFQTDINNLYSSQVDMQKDIERVKTRLNLSETEQ
ncbi:MAG: hypothetical protein ACU85E_16135 [Gammaproteobacteria bacterium]